MARLGIKRGEIMIKNKKLMLIISILLVAMFLAGCNVLPRAMNLIEEDDVREDLDDILKAIEEKNIDYIYNEYFSFLEKQELERGMNEIIDIYKGERVGTQYYRFDIRSFSSLGNDHRKTTNKTVIYLIKTTETTYSIEMTYIKEGSGEYELKGFYVSPYLDYVVNAGFSNYTNKNWVMFALNVVSYGLMILALILCIKTKIKKKALWIILILLQVGVTITLFPQQFRVHYSFIQFLGFSKYLLYAHGGTITSVFVHIFAIVFLFVRKSLNKKYIYKEQLKKEREEKEQQLRAEYAASFRI